MYEVSLVPENGLLTPNPRDLNKLWGPTFLTNPGWPKRLTRPAAGQVKSISALGTYMVAFRGQDGKALVSWGRLDGGWLHCWPNPPNLGRETPNWMVQLHHFLWQHMYFAGIPMYCVRDVRLLVMLSDGEGELWWGWWWIDELMPIWIILRSTVATKALLWDNFAGTWLPNPSACSDGNRVAPIGESQPQEGERGCFTMFYPLVI